jgi:hypothetical protein
MGSIVAHITVTKTALVILRVTGDASILESISTGRIDEYERLVCGAHT